MKKNVKNIGSCLTGLLLLSSLFIGCQSTKVNLIEDSPMAIVSVYSNSHMPWYDKDAEKTEDNDDDSGDGLLNNAVAGLISKNDPEYITLQDRIDEAEATLLRELESSGVVLVDKDTVQGSRSLSGGGNGFLSFMETKTVATGYQKITDASSKKIKDLMRETGAKSASIVYFKFQKEKVNVGVFDIEARVRCVMDVTTFNAAGRKIVNKEYVGYSFSTVPYKNGNWDKQALCNVVHEAVESAVAQFIYGNTIPVFVENDTEEEVINVNATPLALPVIQQ